MKTFWGSGGKLHAFLTSALYGGQWSSSRPGRFTQRERAPDTHWIELGGPQSRSGHGFEKISQPPSEIEPQSSDHPAHSQSLYRFLLRQHIETKFLPSNATQDRQLNKLF